MEIEEAITHLEDGIRRLKVQFEMFFAGATPRPPTEMRVEIERLIRRFANGSIRRYSDRFHFNTLVGRYNCLSELWNKQLRALEEGRERLAVGPKRSLSVDPAGSAGTPIRDSQGVGRGTEPANGAPSGGERVLCTLRVADPQADPGALRALYQQYLEARELREGAAPKLSLNSFVKQISRQVDSLKASSGCGAVEFRLTNTESQIAIKARPAASERREAERPASGGSSEMEEAL